MDHYAKNFEGFDGIDGGSRSGSEVNGNQPTGIRGHQTANLGRRPYCNLDDPRNLS